MIAYISGGASRGVLLEGGQFYGFILDQEKPLNLSKAQLPNFFMHAWDVEEYECPSHADFKDRLESLWRQDRTSYMALISFDEGYSPELRMEAAHCAEALLTDEACMQSLLSKLYAYPLPQRINVHEISNFLNLTGSKRLEEIFDSIVVRQDAIKKCVLAWENLPDSLFESAVEREEIRTRIIRTGAFYNFASSESGSNDAIFRILADPILAGRSARAREIVRFWASRYKEAPTQNIGYFGFEIDDKNDYHGKQIQSSSFEIYERVKKQISVIKSEYSMGRAERADDLVESLVEDQRRRGSSEHVAKSLCNIAIYVRDLGDVDRFYSLSRRATEEAPSDAWSYTQFGYACIARNDFDAGMRAFEKAQIYGDERSALIGRAEVLKYLGEKDSALATLQDCVNAFPLNDVAKNARASLYAHFGDFTEALDVYNNLAESPFASAHVFGGRAAVLSSLGRFEEAIRDEEMAISLADRSDVIPYCGKADLLREVRRFDEALNVIKVVEHTPQTGLPLGLTGVRIFRDEGKLDEAERLLNELKHAYPYDVNTRIAIAELYRHRGQFDVSLSLFLDIESSFSYSKIARNSMASTFAALNRFEEALSYLPIRRPCTRGDWVSQHIRAMIDMKNGNLDTAMKMLQEGFEHCPWKQQRPYFASALATCYIRVKKHDEAISILESATPRSTLNAECLMSAVKAHALVVGGEGLSFSSPVGNAGLNSCSAPLVIKFLEDLRSYRANALSNDQLFDSESQMLLGMAA